MKVTELIGKKVLDDNAMEIGKINDLDVELKDNTINYVYITSSDMGLRKNTFKITMDMVEEAGDYILLNTVKSDLIEEDKDDGRVDDVEIVDPNKLNQE
ncbi:MAG: PRC-barrel domain-containing protein [Methanosphaera sp.]|nr:PRC-barrel domain-containing protein [Methanosphaera sp.]